MPPSYASNCARVGSRAVSLGNPSVLHSWGKQAPEMTQWCTVCLRSRVNLDFHGKYFAFKFTIDISDDLCLAITVCVSVNSVFLITIVYFTPIAIA